MSGHSNGALSPGFGQQVLSTTDLALMAFYLMNGVELVKVERRGGASSRAQDFVFIFRDPDSKTEQLRYAWANSPMRDFDNAMRTLKKMCQEMRREHRQHNGSGKGARGH